MRRYVVFLLVCYVGSEAALLDWIFGSHPEPEQKNEVVVEESLTNTLLKLKQYKHTSSGSSFEMKTMDEKFLQTQTGKELSLLSEQDACHHKVVAKLKMACGRLTEEQIGKLGVLLLNCQLEAEDRKIYPCADDMTLGQCTKSMSPTVWNAYQIVSNRARAVCYATQQQQFRLKAEYTVNKLVHSTEEQLHAIDHLKEGQSQIHEATTDTLRKMFDGQQELMGRQQMLKSAQQDIQTYISDNLKELTKEKAMIATGNKEIAEMTDNIRKKIDQATNILFHQESEQKENHAELLEDLALIREKAKEVWEKIDNSSKNVLTYHSETAEQYKKTLENLERVNSTINFIMNTMTEMKSGIDTRLSWLTDLLGGTEDKVTILTICSIHVVYFLLAALSVSFMQTPWFTRLILLISVPLNAFSAIKNGVCLDMPAMTMFILLTTVANYIVLYSYHLVNGLVSSNVEKKDISDHHCTNQCTGTFNSPIPLVPSTPIAGSLSDRELKKIATKLKSLMKHELIRSSRESTPNISQISNDSAIDNRVHSWLDNSKNFQDCDSYSNDVTTISAATKTTKKENETVDEFASLLFADEETFESVSMVGEKIVDVTGMGKSPEKELMKKHLLKKLDGKTTERKSRSRSLTPRDRRSTTPVTSHSVSRVSGRSSTPSYRSRASTLSGSRPQCAAITNIGNMCKFRSLEGSLFCHKHGSK